MALQPQNKPDLEAALTAVMATTAGPECPQQLARALHHAVFPGGARIRPKLCLAIAMANGSDSLELAMRAACAIELLHCASLVHDDLPCFDDADIRRGKPSVHRAFGEPIAVLVGDALIVAALETVATGELTGTAALRMPGVFAVLSRGVGAPYGICAGQAWESEPRVDLARYHRAKTGALFIAATRAGAACAGVDGEPWEALGTSIGEAYQVADDIQDAIATPDTLGKPCHQDEHLDRPNAVAQLGVQGAARRLRDLIEAGLDSIPACPGREQLVDLVRAQSQGFVPKGLSRAA
ncbi:MAG: polyprenyl synthetase family protein [Halieaceae bacterium]|jgi:geranylgeranyl diphosphate synthase type II|nr:polyprenyl synthetase family protein [Halieaceae bacterium]